MTEIDGSRQRADDTAPIDPGARVPPAAPAASARLISRRQAIGRVSKGAVAAGVAAWVIPEVVVATPTTAGALSAPPSQPGGSPGGGSTPGGGGGAAASPGGSASQGSAPGASPGAGGGSGTSGSPPGPGSAGASGSGALPFTGFNALRDAEIGAALVAGGWALTRWTSRARRPVPAEGPGHPEAEDPTA